MKNLFFVFALILMAAAAAAQNTRTTIKTLPKCDTLDVSDLGEHLTIIETLETFSRLEVETSLNSNLSQQTASKIHSVLGVGYSENVRTETINISPLKQDNEFFINVNGTDIDMKRSYKLFVPEGTYIKR